MEVDTRQLIQPFGQHFTMSLPTTTCVALSQSQAYTAEMGQRMLDCNPRVRLVFQSFHGQGMPVPMPYPNSIYMPHPLRAGYPRPGLPANFMCREEPKPQYSYIGLIAMAILSSKEKKLVLSDIYQWILDNYIYFRQRGPGWRNSIRHNLSLNDCFVKVSRSANGKGHYWAIHEANLEDFKKGDFRRRRAQNKVRKAMGLEITDNDEDDDSPCISPVVEPPGMNWQGSAQQRNESPPDVSMCSSGSSYVYSNVYNEDPNPINLSVQGPSCSRNSPAIISSAFTQSPPYHEIKRLEAKEHDGTLNKTMSHEPGLYQTYPISSCAPSSAITQERPRKKRAFNIDSLLAPDDTSEIEGPKRQCQELTDASTIHT